MAYTTQNGQVIQIARGNLKKRLSAKPLAQGELFIHISGELDVSATNTDVGITDLVTNSKLTKIFNGDLFAGANSKTKVYYIGSGSSLKWGGVYSGTYASLCELVRSNPNKIYMYLGNGTFTINSQPGNYNTSANEDDASKSTKYVGHEASEINGKINPGDLMFYSPALQQEVTIHTNHSSDATTTINTKALISNSLKNLLTDISSKYSGDNIFYGACGDNVSLKSYLDGPARHYQYLLDSEGWNKITISTASTIKGDETTGTSTVTPGDITIAAGEDIDGAIHYIPFDTKNPCQLKYTTKLDGLTDAELYEGDLIFSLPTSTGGVTHKRVSLYHLLAEQLKLTWGKKRGDDYATSIWEEGATVGDETYVGDLSYFANNRKLQDFINRLFESKVDLDPITHKIISSQIPDYLLGAPKYQGHFEGTAENWKNVSSTTTAATFITNVLGKADWSNLDKNEDDTSTSDVTLQSGCYWIYTGVTEDVSNFTGIFHFDSNKDDYNTSDKKEGAQHYLNKGDYIIYNGENKLFEVIDNTSSFIGILIDSTKVAGVVNFKHPLRNADTISLGDDTGKFVDTQVSAKETQLTADASNITFTNPDTVLFKNGDDALTDSSHIPLISNTGYAYNSIISLNDEQNTLTVPFNKEGLDTESKLTKVNFAFGSIEPEDDKTYEFTQSIFDRNVTVSHQFTIDEDSFRFQLFKFEEDSGKTGNSSYSYDISRESNPSLMLPAHSGTLATESYVDTGFAVIQSAIDDSYQTLLDNTTKGHVDWLQTLRNKSSADGKKEIYDSKIKQDFSDTEHLILQLFYDIKDADGKEYDEETGTGYAKLSVYQNLNDSSDTSIGKTLDYTSDLTLGNADEGTTTTLNPSTRTSGPVENVLPNHSGVLLNNNSVIDGGYWA